MGLIMKIQFYLLFLFLILFSACSSTKHLPPGVIFTFDDGWENVYLNAVPIFDEYNITGTVFLTTSFIEVYGYVDSTQIRSMIDRGWEIGTHSIYHESFLYLSTDSLYLNLILPKIELEQKFDIEIQHIATAYGEFNDDVISSIRKFYATHSNAFSETRGLNELSNIDFYNIHRWDITQEVEIDEVCQRINSLEEGQVIVLLFHQIRNDVFGNWHLSISDFERIVKCATKVNVYNYLNLLNHEKQK